MFQVQVNVSGERKMLYPGKCKTTNDAEFLLKFGRRIVTCCRTKPSRTFGHTSAFAELRPISSMKPVTTVWGSSSLETGLLLTSDQARFDCSLISLNAQPVQRDLLCMTSAAVDDVPNVSGQV